VKGVLQVKRLAYVLLVAALLVTSCKRVDIEVHDGEPSQPVLTQEGPVKGIEVPGGAHSLRVSTKENPDIQFETTDSEAMRTFADALGQAERVETSEAIGLSLIAEYEFVFWEQPMLKHFPRALGGTRRLMRDSKGNGFIHAGAGYIYRIPADEYQQMQSVIKEEMPTASPEREVEAFGFYSTTLHTSIEIVLHNQSTRWYSIIGQAYDFFDPSSASHKGITEGDHISMSLGHGELYTADETYRGSFAVVRDAVKADLTEANGVVVQSRDDCIELLTHDGATSVFSLGPEIIEYVRTIQPGSKVTFTSFVSIIGTPTIVALKPS